MAMTKQTKTTAKQPTGIAPGLRNFYKNHKILTLFIFTALVVAVLMGITSYNNRQQRFSDKDYAAITTAVEKIFREVGAKEVAIDESCRYRAPEKFASNRLYCRVEMAVYLPYENDEQAIALAKSFEVEIAGLGQISSSFSRFYETPQNTSTVAVVTLSQPLPKERCNFHIASNEKAKDTIDFLPKKTEDNLIALSFECSAESREEYFPVTYRQGQ